MLCRFPPQGNGRTGRAQYYNGIISVSGIGDTLLQAVMYGQEAGAAPPEGGSGHGL